MARVTIYDMGCSPRRTAMTDRAILDHLKGEST